MSEPLLEKNDRSVAGSQWEINASNILETSDWYHTWTRNFLAMGFYSNVFQESDIGNAAGDHIGSNIVLSLGALFVAWEFYWHLRRANTRSIQNIQGLFSQKTNQEISNDLQNLVNKELSQWRFVISKPRNKWLLFGEKTEEFFLYQKQEHTGIAKENKDNEKFCMSSCIHWLDELFARFHLGDIYQWIFCEFTNGWYWIIWIALVLSASFAIANLPWTVVAALGCMLLSKVIVHSFKYWAKNDNKEVVAVKNCNIHATFTLRWIYIEEKHIDKLLAQDISYKNDKADPRPGKLIDACKILQKTVKSLVAATNNKSVACDNLWELDKLKNVASVSTFLYWYMALNFIPWALGAVIVAIAQFAGLLSIGSVFTVSWPVLVALVAGLFVVTVSIAAYQALKVRVTIEDEFDADYELIKKQNADINTLSILITNNQVYENNIKAAEKRPCTYIDSTAYGDLFGLTQLLDPDDYKFWSLKFFKEFFWQASTGGFIMRIAIGGLLPVTAAGVTELAGVGFFAIVCGIPAIGWGIAAAIFAGAIIYGATRAVHFYQKRKADLAHNILAELDMHIHLQKHKHAKLKEQCERLNIKINDDTANGQTFFTAIANGTSVNAAGNDDSRPSNGY